MASIRENQAMWDGVHHWAENGDEWSEWWGNAESQWRWTLLPRVGRFVPTGTILEIAPGYGRWTNYLKDLSTDLTAVDLSTSCIAFCKEQFSESTHMKFHVNNGTSLDMVEDGSLDFVFSFDSLVHAEADVMESYLTQISRKMKPHGVGFIHHSNIEPYHGHFLIRRALKRLGFLETGEHWRARSMSAKKFEQFANAAGLKCISQELVNWNSSRNIDCFSTFTKVGSKWERDNVVVENPDLMREAASALRLSRLYTSAKDTMVGLKAMR